MKKLLTLVAVLSLSLGASAQDTYRKSWDFTKWSATTVANLQAESAKVTVSADGTSVTDGGGALWSDCEKASGNTTYGISKDNCYWQTGNSSGGIVLTANGETIAETEGLTFTNGSARNLAIAVNYGDCSSVSGAGFGPYHGSSYLWLGGSKKDYFVIPGVKPGTPIKMGVESHKLTDSRGVELYIVASPTALTKGTKLNDRDGNAVAVPNEYAEQEWYLPDEIPAADVDKAAEDGTYSILVYNTNGCHIYYITVGDGDSPQVEEAKKVAYLYNGDLDEDLAYIFLSGDARFDVTPIEAASAPTLESLEEYEVVVVSASVGAAEAAAVRPLIAFIPVVNFSTDLYGALGLGSAADAGTSTLSIADETNAIFEGLEAELEYSGNITGVQLGDYFAQDQVLAKAGDLVGIHTHNPGRNAYYFVPVVNASEDVLMTLIPQTVAAAAKTKRALAAVGTPIISFTQNDGFSTVTITAANSKAIYYTTDGSEPTTASTLYTEPFDLTSACTVKAFAIGDGYTDSQVAEKEITIALRAAAPAIAFERQQGKTLVTITSASGTTSYFNFNGAQTAALSQAYTEPIELTEPTTIYALADGEGLLTSELAEQAIEVDGFNGRTNEIAHFDANQTDWLVDNAEDGGSGSASAYYYWGKNAWNYYTDEVDHVETVLGEDGNPLKSQVEGQEDQDSIITYYKVNEAALKYIYPVNDNGWRLKSAGQVLTGELTLAPGEGVGNGATGRFAEEAIDFITVPTKGVMTFGGKTSGEPYTASIESTVKLQGPFDVVVLCGNGNSGGAGVLEVQTSPDGETWTSIGELKMASTQRYIKRTRVSFNEAAEVFLSVAQVGGGSKAQVYDIIVLNGDGEQAIRDMQADGQQGQAVRTELFSLDGKRMGQAARGIQLVRKTYSDGSVRTEKVLR